MTTEEVTQFQNTIKDTIMPLAQNLTTTQIENIIMNVDEIDEKFKNMLLEQVIILKSKT